jgi:hypothetical protein
MAWEEDEQRWADEERQARIDWLQELGVPAAFHDAIVQANDRRTAPGGSLLGVGVIAGVPVGLAAAAMLLHLLSVNARAVALADVTEATLIHVGGAVGPIILLFSLIGFLGLLALLFDLPGLAGRYRAGPFPSRAAAMLSAPPPRQSLTRRAALWMLSGSVRRAAASSATAQDFVRAAAAHQVRKWALYGLLASTPAIVLTIIESNTFWVAGPSGIAEHRMLPPFSPARRHDLSEAAAVTTGCSDAGNRLIYEIQLASGERFDLGSARPAGGSKIAAIEAIDARLGRNIEHRRWSHLDRNAASPDCLRAWAARFDADGPRRLAGLLRLSIEELNAASSR